MYKVEDIIELIKDYSGLVDVKEDSDIVNDLRITRDDFHDFMQLYAMKFNVNMNDYLWYFHTSEEGGPINLGGLIFPPPYKRVERISLTPSILLDFANKGKWELHYPEHRLMSRRYDIITNKIIIIGFLICLIIWIIIRLTN